METVDEDKYQELRDELRLFLIDYNRQFKDILWAKDRGHYIYVDDDDGRATKLSLPKKFNEVI